MKFSYQSVGAVTPEERTRWNMIWRRWCLIAKHNEHDKDFKLTRDPTAEILWDLHRKTKLEEENQGGIGMGREYFRVRATKFNNLYYAAVEYEAAQAASKKQSHWEDTYTRSRGYQESKKGSWEQKRSTGTSQSTDKLIALRVLGLEAGATEVDIKKAYRALAMKHHPDLGGDASMFVRITQAYETLMR